MAPKTQPKPQTEAAKIVERLRKKGVSYERIAVEVAVSTNTVMRWKRGVIPHPGHLKALRTYATSVQ